MLTQEEIKQIKSIVKRYLDPEIYNMFLFGSHAGKSALKFSDLDIGIKGYKPLPAKTKFQLEDEFEKSDLPYRVDIVDFSDVDDKFKQIAQQKTIALN